MTTLIIIFGVIISVIGILIVSKIHNMNIWCSLGSHRWSKWLFIREETTSTGFTQDVLHRDCKRCGKNECYTGICDVDMFTGEKTPYTFKCD